MQSSKCPHCRGSGVVSPENAVVRELDMGVVPGTRHHQLLNSNELPEEHEVASIRSFTSNVATRLVPLDKEIFELQHRLKQLLSERASLSNLHAKTSAILSPLRRIPPEILSEIFWWTLPAAKDAPRRRRFRPTDSPWILTHICSRWRGVSISDSSLWSLVPISYGPETNSSISTAYPLDMVETQISRASKLKIHFYAHPSCDPGPQVELFTFLAQHSSRWEELSLGSAVYLVPVLASVRDCLPSLRRAYIHGVLQDNQAGSSQSCDYFRQAPCLVDISILNHHRFITFDLPIHNLTHYRFICPWPMHQGVLTMAKNLVEAHIRLDHDDGPWQESGEIIELALLRRLYVSHPKILDYLRTPHLEDFSVTFLDEEVWHLPTCLTSLVSRSLCPLRLLCLAGEHANCTPIEILDRIPSLTDLQIIIDGHDTADSVNSLLLSLTPNAAGGHTVAPRLRAISFAGDCRQFGQSGTTLYCNMIESRWKAKGGTLESSALLLMDVQPVAPIDTQGLDVLRQEGFKFTLVTGLDASHTAAGWNHFPLWN
ncbi:hypothetical protein DFH06DRAFT_574683 [Mycena polygramma]|nr:hypothetical protein DFH06DRAFT_574683 [Mycena polygramma]